MQDNSQESGFPVIVFHKNCVSLKMHKFKIHQNVSVEFWAIFKNAYFSKLQ